MERCIGQFAAALARPFAKPLAGPFAKPLAGPFSRRRASGLSVALRVALGIALGAALLFLGGCFTLSVHPLCDDASLIRDPRLAGLWGPSDDTAGETWEFRPRDDGTYELVIREGDTLRVEPERDGVFTAWLVELDGSRYLDLLPEEPPAGNEFFLSHVIPGHSFWRVEIGRDALSLSVLDSRELDRMIEDSEIAVPTVERDGIRVLTAETPALQDLVSRHRDRLFDDYETLVRLR